MYIRKVLTIHAFITCQAAWLIGKKDRTYKMCPFAVCTDSACGADEQGSKAHDNFLLAAHKGIEERKGRKRLHKLRF